MLWMKVEPLGQKQSVHLLPDQLLHLQGIVQDPEVGLYQQLLLPVGWTEKTEQKKLCTVNMKCIISYAHSSSNCLDLDHGNAIRAKIKNVASKQHTSKFT
jgi:hypothetical protein